jgi:hypothetical protein
MDGYIDDTLVNFDLCNSIMCRYAHLKQRYKLKKPFLEANCQKFEDSLVRFNFQMPPFQQRQMLFEKV